MVEQRSRERTARQTVKVYKEPYGNRPARIRLCFAAKSANSYMGERAKGLACYLSQNIQVSEHYSDTTGIRGGLRCFLCLLGVGKRQDVLYIISMHPMRVLAALICRVLFGTKFIVDTGDLLYEQAKTSGVPFWKCWLIGLWETICIRLPDAIVVHGSFHKELLEQRGFKNVVFVPDGVDTAVTKPANSRGLRAKLGLIDCVTLGIMSTIGWEGNLHIPSPGWDLIACLTRLGDLPLHGVVIGDGPGLPMLEELCRANALEDRIIFLGWVPYVELPSYLGIIDICLHTALNNKMSMVRTTGKLPVMLASGCCMIVSSVGEARRVLRDTEMLLPFNDTLEEYADALAMRVRELVEEGDFQKYCHLGPEIARREFDYRVLSPRVEQLVRKLVLDG